MTTPTQPDSVVPQEAGGSELNGSNVEGIITLTNAQLNNLIEQRFRILQHSTIANEVQGASGSSTATITPLAEDPPPINILNSRHIQYVAFKSPQPLFSQNPLVWFNILEQQFLVAGITTESTKYSHAVSALDARLHNQFADLIIRDKGRTPYTIFKTEILRILGESQKVKLHNILHGLSLGDKKPSQLLNDFKLNAGTAFGEAPIKQLWMGRLPQQVQLVLTAFENDVSLDVLAARADNLLETMSQSHINAVESIPPVQTNIQKTNTANHNQNIDEILGNFKRDMIGEISALLKNQPRGRTHDNGAHPTPPDRTRSNSRSRMNQKYETCYYHHRFGDKAQKCVVGCTFFSNRQAINKPEIQKN